MATEVYHKRDLYKDVTARILAELDLGSSLGPLRPAGNGTCHGNRQCRGKPVANCMGLPAVIGTCHNAVISIFVICITSNEMPGPYSPRTAARPPSVPPSQCGSSLPQSVAPSTD